MLSLKKNSKKSLTDILTTFQKTYTELQEFISTNQENIDATQAKLNQQESEQEQAKNALKHVSKFLGEEVNAES